MYIVRRLPVIATILTTVAHPFVHLGNSPAKNWFFFSPFFYGLQTNWMDVQRIVGLFFLFLLQPHNKKQMLNVWYIYLHLPPKLPSFVGKWARPIEHLGNPRKPRNSSTASSSRLSGFQDFIPLSQKLVESCGSLARASWQLLRPWGLEEW